MKRQATHISRGGQVSIPAVIRHRWDTDALVLEDRGDELVLRPIPRDPVGAVLGSLPLPDGMTSEGMRAQARRQDAEASKRRRPPR
ncbi:MAG: AbrB/MazE/SpoVT family DNA-binding domain-containing protein [Candidatus Dormibacteria bacterium]